MNLLSNDIYIRDIKSALERYDFSRLNGKNVFITGTTGLICSTVVDLLIMLKQEGVEIGIIAAARNVNTLEERFQKNVIAFQYDAMSTVRFPDGIDYIIHGAGCSSPELYTELPVETMLSNIEGVKNLLVYCSRNYSKMVYISSSEVYGKKEKEDYSETDYGYIDIDNIRNSYSESKRASEMLCRSYAKEYGVEVSVVRPGHIYGPTASEKDKRISSCFAYKAAKGERLEMLSSGVQKRSYCYCIDCACAILVCLLNGVSGEAYNIGTKETISIREMATLLAKYGGGELDAKEPTEEERIVFNPMNSSALTYEKIENIGYEQMFSPQVGLKHTVAILRECLNNI